MSVKDLAAPTRYGPTYSEYLGTMDKASFRSRIRRPDEQKVFPRIVYEFNKLSKKNG